MPAPVRIASIDAVDVPAQLYITGITDPVDSDPLVLDRVADANGYPAWSGDGFNVTGEIGTNKYWYLSDDGAANYEATVESDAETPVGLAPWIVSVGVGQPVIQGRPAPPVAVVI